MEENAKVEVNQQYLGENEWSNVKILIDENEYDSGKKPESFGDWTFDCFHTPRGWLLQLGYKFEDGLTWEHGWYTLVINNTNFDDLPEAPERERAPLARSNITYKMDGLIK